MESARGAKSLVSPTKPPLTDRFAQKILRRTSRASLADALAQVLASMAPRLERKVGTATRAVAVLAGTA